MNRIVARQHPISIQLILTQIALVLLTAIAVGLPAVWLIRSELDHQAWMQIQQGIQASHALISARRSNLVNLAILTAERPTLLQLAQQDERATLEGYLQTLQSGAGLDLVLLCGAGQEVIAEAGTPEGIKLCGILPATAASAQTGFYHAADGSPATGWMLASQPVLGGPAGLEVVVGQALDAGYANQIYQQTGLEQILLVDGEFAASSFDEGEAAWEKVASQAALDEAAMKGTPLENGGIFTLNGTPYFSARSRFEDTQLETIVSLSTLEIQSAQQKLTWYIGASILMVCLLGSGIAVWRARQISRPLVRLRDAAESLRKGDLATPIAVKTDIREVALVAYALEDARIALQHSMTQLRQEKAWVDHLLEAVVEGIVIFDRHGRIMFFSQGAERITGWQQVQVLGQTIDATFRLVNDHMAFSQRIPSPGGKQKILVYLSNGRQATLAITGATLAPPEAGKAGTALVLRDVSDEEAIRKLLGEFLANISHEFRTPLSALAASMELLLGQLPDLSQAELGELLNSIHLGVLSLQNLIDNLLEGASIETGRFRVYPRPADLVEIVNEVIKTMQPLADKYQQEIVVELPADLPPVQADPRRTSQVLVNLLSNAIKWSPPGGRVIVRAEGQGELVQVTVADQGPGVPQDRQTDLFRRFAHLRSDSRADHGAGLGLSVVRAIVEAQGGEVGAFNHPGSGAVFWFSLPQAASETTSMGERQLS